MTKFDLFNPSSRWYYPLRILIIFILGLAIYYQTFAFGFVFDDNFFIVNNPYIKNFHDIHSMWITFPITRLIGVYTFAFNYSIGQLNPQGYHIFNFIIHLLTTGLIWVMTRTLFKITGWLAFNDKLREELGFMVTLLFLVHPGQTQAVTYISQRFESIAALFYFSSVLCYLRGRISSVNTHKIYFFFGTIVFVILGILTKETAATIPAMILAVELIFFNRKPLNFKEFSSWKIFLTLSILGSLFIILFVKIVRTNFGIYFHFLVPSQSHDGDLITSSKYLLTQMRVFLTFIRLLMLPINQNVDYDYPLSTGLLSPPLTLAGLGLIGFFVILIFRLHKKSPLIAFGLAWVVITFSINTAPRDNIIFEHKLYLISYGFFLATVCALSTYIKDRKTLFGLLITLIAILSLVSYKRNHVWRDELTLWEDVVMKSPHKSRPYSYRGAAYSNNGEFNKAISDFTRGIELDPKMVEAYNDRGEIYAKQGKFTQAIADYNKAIEVAPTIAVPYFNRGLAFIKLGRFDLAIADFEKDIAMRPKFVPAYGNLGIIYANQGKLVQAIAVFTKALEIDPNYAPAYYNRDKLYYVLKEYDKSWGDVHKAEELGVNIDPGFISMLKKDSGRDN